MWHVMEWRLIAFMVFPARTQKEQAWWVCIYEKYYNMNIRFYQGKFINRMAKIRSLKYKVSSNRYMSFLVFETHKTRVCLPVNELRLFFVWFHKNTSPTNKMRISFCQNHLHGIWVDKCYESKHSLVLARNPHVFNWPKSATQESMGGKENHENCKDIMLKKRFKSCRKSNYLK